MFDSLFSKEAQILAALVLQSGFKYLQGWLMRRNRDERFELVGSVSQLYQYPIKSCRGVSLSNAECTPLGLRHDGVSDRHWMVIQPTGKFLSQRRQPMMALISITTKGDNIQLEAPGVEAIQLPKNVTTYDKCVKKYLMVDCAVEGLDCGDIAAQWVSDYLSYAGLRIVHYTSGLTQRQFCDEVKLWSTTAVEGDLSAYSDWCTYLVACESSLEDLNGHLEKPVTMRTFRPNIVIHGTDAWDEDQWEELKIGEKIQMRCLDGCTRCRMTLVDPDAGVMSTDGQPLSTLKNHHSLPVFDNEPVFGMNTAVDVCGEISIGDPVYAIRRQGK